MENIIIKILKEHFPQYEAEHNIASYKIKAVNSMMKCRTIELGGHVQQCEKCGHMDVWYNSCKNRSCPQCSDIKKNEWLDKQAEKLLNSDYYHIVFTIPVEINIFWNHNPEFIINNIFNSAKHSLDYFLKDNKYLGAAPGMIATLHTWGSNLFLHIHVHFLVSAGGITSKGLWKPHEGKFFIPAKALSIVFRAEFLTKLKKAAKSKKIKLPGNMNISQIYALIDSLFNKKWNVHIQEKYSHGKGIISYLAKYIKGGPINQNRIISYNRKFIKFKYKDYKNRKKNGKPNKKIMTLKVNDFISRFLFHIPPPRINTVRYYGLFSPNSIDKLNYVRKLLKQVPIEKPVNLHESEEIFENRKLCPNCNNIKIVFNNYNSSQLKILIEKIEKKYPP